MTAILDAAATRAALPYERLIEALTTAVVERAAGRIRCPERLVVPLRDGTTLLSMPAVADDVAIHKLITVASRNAGRGLPVILGSVAVIDPWTGQVRLVLDGPTVTGRRTAALSLLAVAVLGHGRVGSALLVGTGVQAQHHADALAALHPHVALRVRGRSAASVEAFCRLNAGHPGGIAADAGERFDVVFTCTTSRTPVYDDAARLGTLLVAVGAFQPDAAEIARATVLASAAWVDDLAGARHEAGDLIRAGVDWSGVAALADALTGARPDANRPRLFKSVGCAAWDLAAARVALAASRS